MGFFTLKNSTKTRVKVVFILTSMSTNGRKQMNTEIMHLIVAMCQLR